MNLCQKGQSELRMTILWLHRTLESKGGKFLEGFCGVGLLTGGKRGVKWTFIPIIVEE